ncbi:MAG: hypothetical protein ABIR29_13890 [Chthoniobacterales bacterium]
MDITLAKQILHAVELKANAGYEVHGRKMRHEAELMREAGWLELTKSNGARSKILARLTKVGHQVSLLFQDDAISRRLHAAFMPRSSTNPL